MPGFFGNTAGGDMEFGVNPNWPGMKLCEPPPFVKLIRPSRTCTYKPGTCIGGKGGLDGPGTNVTASEALPCAAHDSAEARTLARR